jgi:hypothetical protein
MLRRVPPCWSWCRRLLSAGLHFLEFDVTVAVGPFAIRVEAFLESMGLSKLEDP